MENTMKMYITADEVAELLGVSRGYAYKVIRGLNDELKAKGMEANFADILKNVQERDYIDSHRETSPLRKADDAIELDNSNISIAEQKQWLLQQYEKVCKA